MEVDDAMVERGARAMAAETWKTGYFKSQADHVESEWKLLAPLIRVALTAALQPVT